MDIEKNNNKTTTIRIHNSTKELLNNFGEKPESYEDIILRLLTEV